MVVHMHDDNGYDNEGVEKEGDEGEEEEDEDDDDDSESFYEPWQCLSDREIGRGSTPLHLGIEAGQPVCVSMLLRYAQLTLPASRARLNTFMINGHF